jgi:hypothetical protein
MPGAVVENPEVVGEFGIIEGLTRMEASEGLWQFDEDDWALYAMLCDPVNFSELLFEDRKNEEYGGCYHVIDYQYPLFRYTPGEPYEIDACARSVGKTESAQGEGVQPRRSAATVTTLLISGPELIHLDAALSTP